MRDFGEKYANLGPVIVETEWNSDNPSVSAEKGGQWDHAEP